MSAIVCTRIPPLTLSEWSDYTGLSARELADVIGEAHSYDPPPAPMSWSDWKRYHEDDPAAAVLRGQGRTR